MKILIDTNVILDLLLDREPFANDAYNILDKCVRGEMDGCITTTSVTDIFYIAGKCVGDIHILYFLMEELLEKLTLIGVRNSDLMEAIDRKELDFEDCLISVCAERAGCDKIVTRNVKDFKNSNVPAVLPADMIRMA